MSFCAVQAQECRLSCTSYANSSICRAGHSATFQYPSVVLVSIRENLVRQPLRKSIGCFRVEGGHRGSFLEAWGMPCVLPASGEPNIRSQHHSRRTPSQGSGDRRAIQAFEGTSFQGRFARIFEESWGAFGGLAVESTQGMRICVGANQKVIGGLVLAERQEARTPECRRR